MDEASSPSLSAISSTTVFSGTGTITLTGTNLDLIAASDVRVVLENKITKEKTVVTPDSVDATTITFTMPSVSAAPYSVRARLDPNGETNSIALNIKAKFNPTSYSGSVEGGHITLTGEGLPTGWPSKLFTIEVSVGGILKDPVVVSSSPTELVLEAPAGSNGVSYSISLIDPIELTSTATFTQSTSSTPSLALSTTTATAGSLTTVSLTQSNLNSVPANTVYVYNVLDEDNLD